MLRIAAKVCTIVLVTLLLSERCCCLEVFYNNEVNNELLIAEGLPVPKSDEANEGLFEKPHQPTEALRYDLLKLFYGGNYRQNENVMRANVLSSDPISEETQNNVQDNEVSDSDESINDEKQEGEIPAKSRVIRQAYNGQQHLYPTLPTSPPYYPNPTYPNQNQQWQPPRNNFQPGYSSNGSINSYPSNPSYGNSNNYNTNQNQQWLPPRNNSQSGYSSNSSFNSYPSNPSYGISPYNQNSSNYSNHNSAGQFPNYKPPYSGYRPPNNTIYNSGTGRPFQHGQFNGTYSSQRPPYSITTPRNTFPVIYHPPVNNYNTTFGSGNRYNQTSGPYSTPQNGQNPQYFNPYPNNPYGRNSTYPLNVPTQRPFNPAYNPSNSYPGNNSVRPGQYTYNSNNASAWPGHGNAPGGIQTSPYGQNPPSFNPYLGPQNPPYNQYPGGNQFSSNSQGADTFNLANGFNPSIPNRPPYNSGPGQTQFNSPYANSGTTQDPTKVNPGYFSYPH